MTDRAIITVMYALGMGRCLSEIIVSHIPVYISYDVWVVLKANDFQWIYTDKRAFWRLK